VRAKVLGRAVNRPDRLLGAELASVAHSWRRGTRRAEGTAAARDRGGITTLAVESSIALGGFRMSVAAVVPDRARSGLGSHSTALEAGDSLRRFSSGHSSDRSHHQASCH